MFQSSLVRVLIISVLGVAAFTSSGQPKILSGIIDSDTYLSESQYLITTNLKVTQNATLKVAPGTELIFGEGVVLKIEGGLDMQGGPNQFVKVKTESGQVEALGLEIWGSNTKTVTIAYTKFQNCIKPIDFKAGWYRSKSVVVHNQFTNVTSGEPGIVIHSPDEIINQEKMSLQFSYNSFWGNNSSIFVEGYDSDILDFEFSHNLLFGNHYYGASVGGVFTSPVYFLADANEHEAKKETQNNSVFFNNLLDGGTDTIIQENNLGLSGRAEKFAWGSNFMGIKTQVESLNEMDHFMNNSYSPFVDVESWLAQPDANVPGHIWKTEINAKHYKLRDSLPLMEGETVFTLHFNRSVLPKDTAVILDYTFYNEEDKVSETVQIPFKANWSENLSMLYATVQPESMPAAEHFYLSFSGLRDEEGFDVPAIHPGKNHYNKQMELIRQQELAEQEAAAGSTSPWDSAGYQQGGGRYPVDGLGIELTDKKNAKQMDSFIGSWLVGAFIGESIYFGDLTTENYPNPAFGHLALGIRLKYNANEKYSINGNFFYSNLSGTDHDGKNDHRNLHFRTVLYEASLQFEYHLSRFRYSHYKKFIPSITAGVAGFYTNPQASHNGEWYNLQPIGTAGQTTSQGRQPYSLYNFSLPIGFNVKKIIANNWVVDFSMEWRYSFTDYIDDLGGGFYPDPDALIAANPELGTVANELANPGGYQPGYPRGNPDVNDWYIIMGFTFSRVFR